MQIHKSASSAVQTINNAVGVFKGAASLFDAFLNQQNQGGVEEGMKDAPNVKLFPNPVSQKVEVLYEQPEEGELEIHIMDLSGQIIKNIICTHCSKTSIDVSELANGFYPCKIYWNRKLIKVDKINVLH